MKNTIWDAVVIGAGPAGSITAREIARGGFEVLLLEKDRAVGMPVRCAEGVGYRGLLEFYQPHESWISARITRFVITAPDGTDVEVNTPDDGYVLDRTRFDRMIAEDAVSEGVCLMTGRCATGLVYEDGKLTGVRVRAAYDEYIVRTRLVVGADGVESLVGRWAGIRTQCKPKDMEVCVQDTLTDIDIAENCCQFIYGRGHAPGGYAWIFSKGLRTANVGLGISGRYCDGKCAREYLDEFIRGRFDGASVLNRTSGGVPCSGGLKEMVSDGVMVVGDAAHMANPLTGGGIVNAMKGGLEAGRVAVKCLKKSDVSCKALSEYERKWNRKLGRMHRQFNKIKDWAQSVEDEVLNRVAHELVKLPVEKRTPSKIIQTVVKENPGLIRIAAKLIF